MMRFYIILTVLITGASCADVNGQQNEVNGLWAQFADDSDVSNQLEIVLVNQNVICRDEIIGDYEPQGDGFSYPDWASLSYDKRIAIYRAAMHSNDRWLHDCFFRWWGYTRIRKANFDMNCMIIDEMPTKLLLPAFSPPLDALELQIVASAKPPLKPLLSSMFFTYFWEGTRYFATGDETAILVSKDFDVYSIEKHPGDKRIKPDIKGRIMPKRLGGNPIKMDEYLVEVPASVSVCRFKDKLYFSLANGYLAKFNITRKKWEPTVDKSFEGKKIVYLSDSKSLYRFVETEKNNWQFMTSTDGTKWSKANEINFEEKFEPFLLTDDYLITLDDSQKDKYLIPTRKRRYNIKDKQGNGWSKVKSVSVPNTVILDACQKNGQLYLLQGKVGKGKKDEMKIAVTKL